MYNSNEENYYNFSEKAEKLLLNYEKNTAYNKKNVSNHNKIQTYNDVMLRKKNDKVISILLNTSFTLAVLLFIFILFDKLYFIL